MPRENLDPPEALTDEIANALGALTPRAPANRDRILFQAGRASARPRSSGRSGKLWPGLAAGFALVAGGEGLLLAHRAPPEVVERLVVVRELAPPVVPPDPPVTVEPDPPVVSPPPLVERSSRSQRVDQIARYGLDGWAEPQPILDATPRLPLLSGRDLFRQEIRDSLSLGDSS